MFLTEKEVAEFTGIGRGCDGKTREQLQATQLKQMGVPFWINARGCPKIVKDYLISGSKAQPKPEQRWKPPAL